MRQACGNPSPAERQVVAAAADRHAPEQAARFLQNTGHDTATWLYVYPASQPCSGLHAASVPAAPCRYRPLQPHASIREAAAEAVRSAAADPAETIEVLADSPDPRLRLPLCADPLKATLPAGARLSGRLTVEVSCTGQQPWRLYLPVRIQSSRQVVVAARSLTRDTILAPGDVRVATLGPGVSGYGAVTDPAQVVGQRLRRSLEAGAPVSAAPARCTIDSEARPAGDARGPCRQLCGTGVRRRQV